MSRIRVTVERDSQRIGSIFLDPGLPPFVYSQHRAALLLALAEVTTALLAEAETLSTETDEQ